MAFSAIPAWLGATDFGLVHIDTETVAKAFQAYLDSGSKLTGVSLEDINRGVYARPADEKTVTLSELVSLGMKLFDAVIWLTAKRPAAYPLQIDPVMEKSKVPSSHEIARAVFYCYFMLLTQARYPVKAGNPNKPNIPSFLTNIMEMTDSQEKYVDKICSFDPSKFDPKWIKFVKFGGFGQEALSRFGLGVAGYRSFGPFKLYEPKPNLPKNIQDAFDFSRSVAKSPASWDIHPLTRDANVLTRRGNLNKNLGNLMLESFTEEQLSEMVKSKILYSKPVYDPNHTQYKSWAAIDDISGNSFIFH